MFTFKHRNHNRFTALFRDHPCESVPEENFWTLWCKGRLGKKGKGFPYSIPSVGPGADPGVQAVSLQVTIKSSTRR